MSVRSSERIVGRCERCGALYQSNPGETTYDPCRGCGGTVRPIGKQGVALTESLTCPSCHAVNRAGARFCVECEEPLGGSPPLLANHTEVVARRRATHELRRAYRSVGAIAWLFRLGAASYVVIAAIAVAALARVEVPIVPGYVVVGLSTLLAVTMILGAIHLPFRPFPWTLAAAVLATGVTAAHAVGPNPLGLASLFSGAWAIGFWIAVFPARSMEGLIAKHTDLYIEHHASRATKRSLVGRTAKERHRRLVNAMRRASRRAWRLSVTISLLLVVLSAAGAFLVRETLRPELLEDALAEFRSAWEAEGIEGVAALLPPEGRAPATRLLAGMAEGNGIAPESPELERTELDRGEVDTFAFYDVGGVELRARWRLLGTDWSLRELILPRPPFEPVRERFLAAWESSDPAAVAAFYPKAHRASRQASLESLVERRKWESFPAIEDVETRDEGGDVVDVDLETTDALVKTSWLFREDGRWHLHVFEVRNLRRRR